MILAEGYESESGDWIPEIHDDQDVNMRTVIYELALHEGLGVDGVVEYQMRVRTTMQPVELAEDLLHEVRLGLDLGALKPDLANRLMDLLDNVS